MSTPERLHLTGAFRYSRNPMYLGIGIGLFGLAMMLSSYVNFVFPILFVLIMDFVYIRKEERILLDRFGAEYSRCRKAVRRWI